MWVSQSNHQGYYIESQSLRRKYIQRVESVFGLLVRSLPFLATKLKITPRRKCDASPGYTRGVLAVFPCSGCQCSCAWATDWMAVDWLTVHSVDMLSVCTYVWYFTCVSVRSTYHCKPRTGTSVLLVRETLPSVRMARQRLAPFQN